ncbi:MAG: tRNA 2-thiouridine(34) synthase MnmA [Planctomycetota bacterium]|nr:MAG: tRNA 2-thiouridine(34) synthase MnmA [Planctomycetota bacterium]
MKVALLLSGGVDSSVALRLLLEQGHEVEAFYLKIWLEDELAFLGECPWEEDLRFAQAVCKQAGVKLHVLSLQREYYQRVVQYTLDELRAGFTPSPDIFCNQRIKFGVFFEKISPSFEKVASGHYARLEWQDKIPLLKTSPDPVKDQTYFLAHLDISQLQRCLFPLGNYTKAKVRQLASDFALVNSSRKDSQGICFLGKIKFSEFIRHHLGTKEGDLVEWETSKILGKHSGYWYYTIGQRKGIGLSGGPWYVVGKDIDQNIVYISHRRHLEQRSRNSFEVGEVHWLHPDMPAPTRVKIRHGPQFYSCRFEREQRRVRILDGKDPGVAAGQFAVFYQGDTCLGCAKILPAPMPVPP